MNCKNCEVELQQNQNFCGQCGGQIVSERLTVGRIWNNLVDQFFGWDNKYLRTIKCLLLRPETVIRPYLNGTRKKFVAPFTFLAIGTAVAMLVFNQFSEEYMEMAHTLSGVEYDFIENRLNTPEQIASFEAQKASQTEMNDKIQGSILKYFNIITFLMVPFYALIAFLVFRKPYNYGEHLVIAAFVQGFTFVISLFFFLASIFIHPAIFSLSMLFSILYYLHAYKRIYDLTLGRTFIKFLKFLGVLTLGAISITLIGIGVIVLLKVLG